MNVPGTPFKALSLALLFFLLQDCNTQQLNAFDVAVFSRSIHDMAEKIRKLSSTVTDNKNELLEILKSYQKDTDQKYAEALEKTNMLDSKAKYIESGLNDSRDAILEVERKSQTTSLRIGLLENILEESQNAIERLETSIIDLSHQVSNWTTSVAADTEEFRALLESHQKDTAENYTEATEMTQNLDSRAKITEAGLDASHNAILNLERNSETTWQKLEETEAAVRETQNSIEELRTSVTSEFPRCHPPSIDISGLGCVFHIDTGLPWDVQRDNCEYRGGRLLEGFNREQFEELKKAFTLRSGNYWIGIRDQRWYSSSRPIVGLDNLWRDRLYPCTQITWGDPHLELYTVRCELHSQALCLSDYMI